jgi:hypothetical protein
MQTDGNLVVIAPGNVPVWASGTSGHPNSKLILQTDGNLVIYSAGGAPIWSTNRYHQAYAADYFDMVTPPTWPGSQFGCLDSLWIRESNWNPFADNPTSSAYGIPQALPGSKMATEGSDWLTNGYTQIRWGEKYIRSRYTNPCGAWNAWLSRSPHWY